MVLLISGFLKILPKLAGIVILAIHPSRFLDLYCLRAKVLMA
jgi:hypothetical protein